MSRSIFRSFVAVAALAATACVDATSPRPSDVAVTVAPRTSSLAAGRFIVTLRSGADPVAVARTHGVAPDFVYRSALIGFAGSIGDAARAGLLADARVAAIEPDGVMEASATVQSPVTWGLDRIDQTGNTLSNSFSYTNTGAGVTAYIIDTGILFSHSEFGGRAVTGVDKVTTGGTALDCNGHGTHVAGTTGGSTYGVAKEVSLVAVRVLDCNGSGTTSGVIAGVDWVTQDHLAKGTPAVANMSLGGGASSALDNAVANSIANGVTYAVAAGNGNQAGIAQDACKYSPARVATAITVSATDKSDTRASWANYGNCVDIFAPGVGITSAWSNGGTNTISGTSMATPHTTGVAALYLQGNPTATPTTVRNALVGAAAKNIVKNAKSTSNALLFTAY